mgnify:CR=1 FL=1
MLLSTTSSLEGWKIIEYIDIVSSRIVTGTDIISDFFADISDMMGGKSKTYQKQLKLLTDTAMEQLELEAQMLNANAVVGIHIDHDEISGKGKQMFMVTVTGTAVVARTKDIDALTLLIEDIIDEDLAYGKVKDITIKNLKIERLLKKTDEAQYSFDFKRKLLLYFNIIGNYAKAEDLLFIVIEDVIDLDIYKELLTEGINFYENLLVKTDFELEQGNLPRDEVVDGLNILKRKIQR